MKKYFFLRFCLKPYIIVEVQFNCVLKEQNVLHFHYTVLFYEKVEKSISQDSRIFIVQRVIHTHR